jgi:hypothetical protein
LRQDYSGVLPSPFAKDAAGHRQKAAMFKIVPDNFVEPRWFSSGTTLVRLVDIFKFIELAKLGEN